MDDRAVIKSIKRKQVFMINDLVRWLSCSLPTCRRRLKQWHAHTSYNHNGRYYTLPDVPSFDTYGLWHHRDISFSIHGNLKQTVISLVTSSAYGLSASEIGEILRMNAQSFLSPFQHEAKLLREKVTGLFIWFAADSEICDRQRQGRLAQEHSPRIALPSDREAVMILVDLLHHPGTDVEKIVHRLKLNRLAVTAKIITTFLIHHDLLKKTTDPDSSAV
jgi:hypothetical protein